MTFFVLCTFCEWSIVHSLAVLKGHPECLKCGKTLCRPGLRPEPLQRSPDALAGGDWAGCPSQYIGARILVNGFGEGRADSVGGVLAKNPTTRAVGPSCQGILAGLQPWPFGQSGLAPCLPKSVYIIIVNPNNLRPYPYHTTLGPAAGPGPYLF